MRTIKTNKNVRDSVRVLTGNQAIAFRMGFRPQAGDIRGGARAVVMPAVSFRTSRGS
jgi:hypothetical protein